jgi:hypothetical protein
MIMKFTELSKEFQSFDCDSESEYRAWMIRLMIEIFGCLDSISYNVNQLRQAWTQPQAAGKPAVVKPKAG